MKLTDLFENRPVETELALSGKNVVLNSEHTLKLYTEDTLLHSFVCSPSALGELCAGWLVTEGYDAEAVEVSPDGSTARVSGILAAPSAPEKLCLFGQVETTPGEMLDLFAQASEEYLRSHGIHECVIKGSGWHILCTDIGRHNAMDKAVGAAVLAGYDLEGAVMFTSGRINVQTVEKAVRCKLGCLMSKAVITQEALTLAQKLGLKVFFSVKETGYLSV